MYKKAYLTDKFSFSMLREDSIIKVTEIEMEEIYHFGHFDTITQNERQVKKFISDVESIIGQESIASILRFPKSWNANIFEEGDIIFVVELQGGEWTEENLILPERWYFKFFKVEILSSVENADQ